MPFGYRAVLRDSEEPESRPSVQVLHGEQGIYPKLSEDYAEHIRSQNSEIQLSSFELVEFSNEDVVLYAPDARVQLELVADPPMLCVVKIGPDGEPSGPALMETPTKTISGRYDQAAEEIVSGTIRYKDDESCTYEGEMRDLRPDGEGVLVSATSTVRGSFRGGKPHGHCVLTRVSDLTGVEGTFVAGEATGESFNVESARFVYNGGLRDMRFHGRGVLQLRKLPVRYVGGFEDGGFSGAGELVIDGLLTYRGSFQAGAMTGAGEMALANGWTVRGAFVDGVPSGQAEISQGSGETLVSAEWVDGRVPLGGEAGSDMWLEVKMPFVYVGGFASGARHGRGRLTNIQNGETYDGEFVNGEFDGHGVLQTAQLSYSGGFHCGKFEGFGTICYANGCTFSGEFRRDKRLRGCFEDPSARRKYEGEYRHDVPHGRGRLFEDGNLVCDGLWKHGHWAGPGSGAGTSREGAGQENGSGGD